VHRADVQQTVMRGGDDVLETVSHASRHT